MYLSRFHSFFNKEMYSKRHVKFTDLDTDYPKNTMALIEDKTINDALLEFVAPLAVSYRLPQLYASCYWALRFMVNELCVKPITFGSALTPGSPVCIRVVFNINDTQNVFVNADGTVIGHMVDLVTRFVCVQELVDFKALYSFLTYKQ